MKKLKDNTDAVQRNLEYYNEVAASYDSIMRADIKNAQIRKLVAQKFQDLVPKGTVIDFGGGTGLDLEWMSNAGYTIYFCEPSVSMRDQAIDCNNTSLKNDRIVFLPAGESDFRSWTKCYPFEGHIDGILSNFGVINYIPDIELLIDRFAKLLQHGGHFVLTMLKFDFRKKFSWHRRNAVRSLLFQRPFRMYIPFKDELQHVFVHTGAEIQRLSGKYFDYSEFKFPPSIDFILIDLVRNEKPYKKVADR